jgi:tetratricopeptide (TPR) repeat protein
MTEVTLAEALKLGVAAHKAGHFSSADKYYTAILEADPNNSDANHNLGMLAMEVGKTNIAITYLEKATEVRPDIFQYWLSLFQVLLKLGLSSKIKDLYEKAVASEIKEQELSELAEIYRKSQKQIIKEENLAETLKYFTTLYNQQEYSSIINQGADLINQHPNNVVFVNLYASALHATKRHSEAVRLYREIINREPLNERLHNNLGVALYSDNKFSEAISSHEKAIRINPNYSDAHYNLGNALSANEQYDEAIESYYAALKLNSDSSFTHNNLGNVFEKLHEYDLAQKHYEKSVEMDPNLPSALYNLGNIKRIKNQFHDAIICYEKSLILEPNNVEALTNLGVCFHEVGDLSSAFKTYSKALDLADRVHIAHNNLGNIYLDIGDVKNAKQSYKKSLASNPDYADAHRNLSRLEDYRTSSPQIKQIEKLLTDESINLNERIQLHHAYATINEKLGNIEIAFNHFVEAGALRQRLLNYNIAQDEEIFERIKKNTLHFNLNNLTIEKLRTQNNPIFIVGMPRSGTTLVEQIISSHSLVNAAGELPFLSELCHPILSKNKTIFSDELLNIRTHYLNKLEKFAGENKFITDKMPQNFYYIGLITKIFPEAKIIHVSRDPHALCWSNFKQYFSSNGLGYSYNLEDTVKYHKLYKDLMNFWRAQTEDKIFEFSYDKLVNDPEHWTRKLISFIGLDWDDKCLKPEDNTRLVRTASQDQVRKTIYQNSNNTWRRYKNHIGSVFDDL